MIQCGKPPYLECSSKGEKRLSAFYARPSSLNGRSIEEAYQAMKILPDGQTDLSIKDAKGKVPINQEDCTIAYRRWWHEYILENRSLELLLVRSTGLSDIFGQKRHVCQAEVLWDIKRTVEHKLKLIVAGSRSFDDYKLLQTKLDGFLKYKDIYQFTLICGGAKGADSLGEQYAKQKKFPIEYFYADWDNNGKSAGYIRNGEMAKVAHACIIFWDGQSKGSRHMYDLAKQEGLETYIIKY